LKDTITETFSTPSGAGNIRKANKQQAYVLMMLS